MAQNVERYNTSGERTAYGTDVADVQTSQNASEGDVIKISGDATHNTAVTTSNYTNKLFSVQSATSGESQTVSAGAVQQYSLSASEYTISIADVNYKGNSATLNYWGDFMNVPSGATVNLTLDNVSFSEFKTNYSGGVFNVEGELNITSNSEISFTNNHADNTSGSATNNYGVGAVFLIKDNSALNIDGETIQFSNNSIYRFGSICCLGDKSPLSITGSVIKFENNSSANTDGAAIATNGRVTITGKDDNSVTTFNNNTSHHIGGAISAQSYAVFSKGSFYFDNNKLRTRITSNYHGGGAIDTRNLSITDAKVVSFTNNESLYAGGAVNITSHTVGTSPNGFIIQADKIIFDSNTGQGYGGAIGIQADCTAEIKGNSISFTNNQTSGYTECDGGAVRTQDLLIITGYGDNSTILFKNNSAGRYGGAHSGDHLRISSNNTSFINNSAGSCGGAIYAYGVTFEGDGSTGTFTGNTARQGNDIYLYTTSETKSVLTFKDNGTYYFDGGIYLNPTDAETIIDKSQVTIAGRENDTTNTYQLRKTTLSNGGKLITNLDYINKIEGTQITLSDSVSQVELTNALMNQTARIKSSTGNGTFILEYLAAAGNVQNESLVISSGRIDAKGCMAANVSVEANTTFSPGNSVGSVNVDGDFKLTGELLMEVDGTGADILTCNTFTMNGGTVVLNWQNDEIPFFSTLDIIISESTDLSGVYENLVENIDFSTSPTVERLYNDGYIKALLVGDNKIIQLSIDRNAVPEPSTWALLILGAAGLLYWRKRKN